MALVMPDYNHPTRIAYFDRQVRSSILRVYYHQENGTIEAAIWVDLLDRVEDHLRSGIAFTTFEREVLQDARDECQHQITMLVEPGDFWRCLAN